MLIKRLTLKKLLSFNDSTVELGPLNVLIGPNAVGKSNLIEVISLLQAAPSSLTGGLNLGGSISQWIWLGDRGHPRTASIDCELVLADDRRQANPLLYHLEFSNGDPGFVILNESLARSRPVGHAFSDIFFQRNVTGADFPYLSPPNTDTNIAQTESVLSQFKSPVDSTPITEVGRQFSQIRIFREFRTGPGSRVRWGISTSLPKDWLADGGDNLAMVLHELDVLGVRERIKDYLRRFCERFEDVKISIGDGLARTILRETGLVEMLSAIRMSDGTLKFLALLAALFHPKPPPLMCIEEPEVGLHPDAIQLVAEALVEASESMQLIVTTHSEALVDALSDRPEAVLVCERDFDNGTQFKRLSKEHLREWLQDYSLGQLWRKGEIGGGRW